LYSKTDFETAQVTVRIVRDHPIMAALANIQPIAPSMETMKSNKRSRQSRRLNGHGGYKKETVLNVTKDMSIKDLKLEVSAKFDAWRTLFIIEISWKIVLG
jgi:hypothetical protein